MYAAAVIFGVSEADVGSETVCMSRSRNRVRGVDCGAFQLSILTLTSLPVCRSTFRCNLVHSMMATKRKQKMKPFATFECGQMSRQNYKCLKVLKISCYNKYASFTKSHNEHMIS
jgi:hypothetical protein